MIKLWGRSNSSNVQKAMWAIGELGLAHERDDVGGAFGGNDQTWYLKMKPQGGVRTISDDGLARATAATWWAMSSMVTERVSS